MSWFSHTVGARILALLANGGGLTIAEACTRALADMAELHPECDASRGPSATLVVTRFDDGKRTLEYLVLCDSSLVVLRANGEVEQITDEQIVEAGRRNRQRPAGERVDPESLRNAEGGFWVARVEPEAIDHAVTGTLQLARGDQVVLASDGALRPVEVTRSWTLRDWADRAADPTGLLVAVHADEEEAAETLRRRGHKPHDDLTVALAAP